MKGKQIIQIAAVLGALGVGIGAFGAHGLQSILEETGRVQTFETAVKYHFYHSLALFLLGILALIKPDWKGWGMAALFFLIGIMIFSGSLYILSVTGITWLGAMAPIGGISLILGWVKIFWTITQN